MGFDLQLIYFVDFFLVCLVFNYWQLVEVSGNEVMGVLFVKGLVGEEFFLSYVFIIYSFCVIMVDQVLMIDYFLVDLLLYLVMIKGKWYEVGVGFIVCL